MAKYDSFIELTPGFESVINLSSKKDDKEFWKHYIVNDDMVTAVKMLSKSLKPDNVPTDVWHFWIQGSYGTGKSYSALVLQHLLQDDYDVVENFLKKNKLFADVRDKFLSIRKKGKFYVTFRDGECANLKTASKFLFEIERSVRSILETNGFTYTGKASLIDSVKKKTREFKSTLQDKYDNGEYQKYWDTYADFEDFYTNVQSGDITACNAAQEILEEMNVGLAASDMATFKAWLKDVFDGNPDLRKTGMFIIWDEFTDYIRYNDLNVLEQLSKYTQEDIPLYIIYVIHQYPGLANENLQANLSHSDARFHKIPISLKEETTLKLIGESIVTKDGMGPSWDEECDKLYDSISGSIQRFMPDPSIEMNASDWKNIFPVHPMTVSLVSRVAEFAASNRSIFKFMKSDEDCGFKAFIHENGPDDWKWVTPDYLWDYYFVNDFGGTKDLSQNAEDALNHYRKVESKVTDPYARRIFKAALLLLATVGSSKTLRKTKGAKGIQATEQTLIDCFCGQLDKDVVVEYLTALGPGRNNDGLNILTLAPDGNGRRIELPYSGTGGELDAEIEKLKNEVSLSKLFDSKGVFGAAIKKQFAPDEKPVVKRLEVDTCWGTTQQINHKFNELAADIDKAPHKFGILLVAIPSADDIQKVKQTLQENLRDKQSDRLMACIIKYPLKPEESDDWYTNCAQAALAQRSGNSVNANNYKSEANVACSTWVSAAIGNEMFFITKDMDAVLYSNKDVLSKYEKLVYKKFPYAPERFIKKTTIYKGVSPRPAYYAAIRAKTPDPTNEKLKGFDQKWIDVVDELSRPDGNIFDCETLADALQVNSTQASESVGKLCSYIDTQMTTGTVFLSDLWRNLQEDMGYYATTVCCYLLGFAFKFYSGKYTWFDGQNSYRLDPDRIATMVADMCADKKQGMKLSSESNVEKRFKKISAKIFTLPEAEVGDVYECRKAIRIKIPKIGYPIWALKYLDDTAYAGLKEKVIEIVDRYDCFIREVDNQSDIMEETVAIFKENAKTYQSLMASLLSDKSLLAEGIKNYIYSVSDKTEQVCNKYGFTFASLYGMLKKSLEEEIWQWKEESVCDRIEKLVLDLEMVGIVNKTISGTAESVEKVRSNLDNMLNFIRIPGCVYEKLGYEWIDALRAMRDISTNKWVGFDTEAKMAAINALETHMAIAVENLNNPISVLKKYIAESGLGTFSAEEYEGLLKKLQKESYDQTESNFKANLKKEIAELAYSTKVKKLQQIWKDASGFDTIKVWSQEHLMPVVWAIPGLSEHFATLLSIERKERVDFSRLDNSITALSGADLSILKDEKHLNECFVKNVSSEQNRDLILPHMDELKKYICQRHPYPSGWQSSIIDIRNLAERFIKENLRTEVGDKAKAKAAEYNEQELRAMLGKILDNCIDACSIILND